MFLSKDSIANVAYDNIPYSTVRNNTHERIYKNNLLIIILSQIQANITPFPVKNVALNS